MALTQREEQFISAVEIYQTLKEGKSFLVSMPAPEAKRLLGQLNVIKSREKKLYEELDLVWANKILKVTEESPDQIKFFTIDPPPKRKYTGFIIIDNNDKT